MTSVGETRRHLKIHVGTTLSLNDPATQHPPKNANYFLSDETIGPHIYTEMMHLRSHIDSNHHLCILYDQENLHQLVAEWQEQNPEDNYHLSLAANKFKLMMRNVALTIGDSVPEGDDHWKLLLVLLEDMDIIISHFISKGDTVYSAQQIQDHHSLFLELVRN